MPTYIYQHPDSGEVIEINQRISDRHEYTDDSGVSWNRVFTVPHTRVPNMTRANANSEEDFIRRTRESGGTMGDLFDLSKELSNKRKSQSKDGKDPVEQKFFKDYSKKRKGMKHQNDVSGSNNSDGVIEI